MVAQASASPNDCKMFETVSPRAGGNRQQPLRCCPLPPASNFGFLHLVVIEEDRAYDSNWSTVTRRAKQEQSFDLTMTRFEVG